MAKKTDEERARDEAREREVAVQRDAMRQRITVVVEMLKKRHNIAQNDIGAKIGTSRAAVGQWVAPKSRSVPNGLQLMALARYAKINGHWLLTGEGSMELRVVVSAGSMTDPWPEWMRDEHPDGAPASKAPSSRPLARSTLRVKT